MMAPGLSRSRRVVVAWLVAGIAYHVSVAFAGASGGLGITGLGAALPFSLGACLWHFRSQLPRVPTRVGIAAFGPFVLHSQVAGR